MVPPIIPPTSQDTPNCPDTEYCLFIGTYEGVPKFKGTNYFQIAPFLTWGKGKITKNKEEKTRKIIRSAQIVFVNTEILERVLEIYKKHTLFFSQKIVFHKLKATIFIR